MKTRLLVIFTFSMGLVILTFLTLGQVQTPAAQANSALETSLAGAMVDTATTQEPRLGFPADVAPEEPSTVGVYTGCGGGTAPIVNAEFEQRVVELVNEVRAQNNLPPLKRAQKLDKAARYHSEDMRQDDYSIFFQAPPPDDLPDDLTSHDSLDRNSAGEFVKICEMGDRVEIYYPDYMYLAENTHHGPTNPEDVMMGWMNSISHANNILSTDVWEIGVGYADDDYWTQDFGRRDDVYPVIINREAATTDSRNVSLYIYGEGDWDEMRLRNDDGDWTDWRSFESTLSWMLNGDQGKHAVWVELRRGNETVTSSDTIIVLPIVTYSISGRIEDENGDPIANVTLTTDTGLTTTTGANGDYTFIDLVAGDYTLTPTKADFMFDPPDLPATVPPNAVGKNFTGTPVSTQTYSITGQVVDGGNNPIADVTLTTDTGLTATTDASGNYTFTNLITGMYTLTPTKPNFTFNPQNLSVSVPPNAVGKNFTGTPVSTQTYSITGQVVDGGNNPIADVTLTTDIGLTATTDASGNYTFTNLITGMYTLTPTKPNFTFNPQNLSVTVPPDAVDQNFTGIMAPTQTYSITGQVVDSGNNPIANVTLTTDTGLTATTDASGNYTFTNLITGMYTLTPTKPNFTFNPQNLSVTVPPDAVDQNFTGTPVSTQTYSITGQVVDGGNNPIADVTLTTDIGLTTTTDASGNYTFTNLITGMYTLTPTKPNFTFNPANRMVSVPPNAVDQNFTGTPVSTQTYSITGQVVDGGNNPIADVTLTTDIGLTTTTDASGNYTFTNLITGMYTLTPTKPNFTFNPANRMVSVPPNAVDQNFTGTPVSTQTQVVIVPPEVELAPGIERITEIQIKNVSNLFGVDFELTFDPTVVEVVDADLSTPGIQITVGNLFTDQEYFNAANLVQSGVISFGVTLTGSATPFTGTGTIAYITWRGLKAGTTELALENVKPSRPNATLIDHNVEDGTITVIGDLTGTTTSGRVLLQGRSDHSGTDIFLIDDDCPQVAQQVAGQSIVPGIPTTKTDSEGNFSIISFPGRTYECLQAIHQGYLVGQHDLPAEENIGTITLLGGDVTEDDEIDIFDLVLIATRYNSNDEIADVNRDGLVDIFDLVIAAINLDGAGPQAWPE